MFIPTIANKFGRWISAGFVSAIIANAGAHVCFVPSHYDILEPDTVQWTDAFGQSMAAAGEWLFIGAPNDDDIETDAGAVYVFRLVNSKWNFHQKLVATGGIGPGRFGSSVALDGKTALIGAQSDREFNLDAGAAYVFRLEGSTWNQAQKLLPQGPGSPKSFGLSVALRAGIAAAGCGGIVGDGLQYRGAAFVFHETGGNFAYVQRLTADVPSSYDEFGSTVAIQEGQLFAACPLYDIPVPNAGAVFIYAWNGSVWTQIDRVQAPDPSIGGFGESFDVEGDVAIFGLPHVVQGIAYVFARMNGVWTYQQTLTPLGVGGADFGASVDIRGEWILIGAPDERFDFFTAGFHYAGAVYRFKENDDAWALDRRMNLYWPDNDDFYGPVECWNMGPQPLDCYSQHAAYLGHTVLVTEAGLLASSDRRVAKCWDSKPSGERHVVNVFAFDQPVDDCNGNSKTDHCELSDCNGNETPDDCDIAAQFSADCNMNEVPDECDAGFHYVLDNGALSISWYANPANGNADFIWLNQFRVKPGGQFISHIALMNTPFIPVDAPVTVLLYTDPTNDGDPSDAQLIATAETTDLIADFNGLSEWIYVRIPTSYIGEVGSHFFVGGVVHPPIPLELYFWAAPVSAHGPPKLRRSWRALAPPGHADIYNLTNNAAPIALHTALPGPYMVRAVASDCNGNGAWDACDIEGGTSTDVNSNGIPDECETTACALMDLMPPGGDGNVNALDLFEVVTHWGACSPCFAICPGDVNEDCNINVSDVLAVISMWGPCPAP